MAESKKIATRDSYGRALLELADAGCNDLVVLDADLSVSTKTCLFRDAYPDRFFECGIAEQDMMGVGRRPCPPSAMCRLPPPLPCLPRAAPMSRSATPSATPT